MSITKSDLNKWMADYPMQGAFKFSGQLLI